jgi:hypothetical protein
LMHEQSPNSTILLEFFPFRFLATSHDVI